MNEAARTETRLRRNELKALSQHIDLVLGHFEDYKRRHGDFGERLPRILEALERSDGFIDDAIAEFDVIANIEALV